MNSDRETVKPKLTLFDLPPEIRLQIYQWVTDTIDLDFIPDPPPPRPAFSDPPQNPELAALMEETFGPMFRPIPSSNGKAIFPSILNICRLIREEAIEIDFIRACRDHQECRETLREITGLKPCSPDVKRRHNTEAAMEASAKAFGIRKSAMRKMKDMGYPVEEWWKRTYKKR